MAQTIKIKRNVTNENAPPANSLVVGEIAINSVTGKLYTKNTSDNVVEISGSGGGSAELTFTVTRVTTGSVHKFHIAGADAGFATATETPIIDLQRGFTYKFDQTDGSNSGHELVITTSSTGGSGESSSEYTTGVSTAGTVGVDRILTFVVPHSSPDTLYYQCSAHAGLGAELNIGDAGGGSVSLTVKDENVTLSTAITQIGFTGSGVTATGNDIITVDVPGGTLPSGGGLGQVLAKSSAASGDASWIDVSNSATMTNTSTETYFEEVGNGANVTSSVTSPGDDYWSDVVFFARGSETITTVTGDDDFASVEFLSQSQNSWDDLSTNNITVANTGATLVTGSSSGEMSFDPGYVWNFDSNGEYVTITSGGLLNLGTGPSTVEFWAKYGTNAWQVIIDAYAGGNDWDFHVGQGGGGANRHQWSGNGAVWNQDPTYTPTNTDYHDNTWHFYQLVKTTSNVKIHVDGVNVASENKTGNLNTNVNWVFGYFIGAGRQWYGQLGPIRVTIGVERAAELPTALFPTAGSTTVFTESSGTTPHTVTLIGGANLTTGSTGKFGEAFNFDGTDDYWTVASDADFGFGAMSGTDGDFTIEAWIFADASNTSDFVIFDGRTAAANSNVPLLERKSNYLKYTVNGVVKITDGDVLPTDAWTHIVVERSGTYTHLFVGGVRKGSFMDTTTYATSPFRVGASSASTAADFFKGKMDDFRISKKARYEITTTGAQGDVHFDSTHYSAQSNAGDGTNVFTDISSNPKTISKQSDTTHETDLGATGDPFGGDRSSMYFDGNDGLYYAIHDDGEITGNFTIDMWIYPTAYSGYKQLYCNFRDDESSQGLSFALSGNNIHWNLSNNASTTSGLNLQTNTWYHVALERYGSTTRFYLDGVIHANSVSFSGTLTNRTAHGVTIGYTPEHTRFFQGYMAEYRVTKVARYEHTSFTKPTAPFLLEDTSSHSGDFTPNTAAFTANAAVTTSTTTYVPGDIYYSTGKVGIGTSLPAFDLDVVGNVNYTGNLYQGGALIQPATKTWKNVDISGVTGETDDSVGDGYFNYVKLLLHMNAEGVAYTTVTDHSSVPSTVVFVGDAQLKPLTNAIAASGDANWTDVHLLESARTTTLQDESTNSIVITNP